MAPADVLAAHGIRRAPEVVELAAAAHLDLACAAVLLVKESGGGRNVWGSDPVPTAGCYDKGSPVVRGDYLAYLGAVARGTAGRQGVGPCQLTAKVYQDQADRAGGCWDWRVNALTGFRVLAGLIAQHGERGGFRRYNGSGTAAEKYADDATARLTVWRARLGATTQEDDMPLSDTDIEKIAAAVWARPTVNAWGDRPHAEGILVATEGRVADVQNQVHTLVAEHDDRGIDLDVLAAKVVALLAARSGEE